jgi:hypothetical protein
MCKYCEALQEDMEEIILAKNGYCSLTMKFEHERDNIVIDSFTLKAAESNVVGIIINYCPICGTKLETDHDRFKHLQSTIR